MVLLPAVVAAVAAAAAAAAAAGFSLVGAGDEEGSLGQFLGLSVRHAAPLTSAAAAQRQGERQTPTREPLVTFKILYTY